MNAMLLLIAVSMTGLMASPLLGCGGNTHSGRSGCLYDPMKPRPVSTVFYFAEAQEDGGFCLYQKKSPRETVKFQESMKLMFKPWTSSASLVPMTSVKQIEAKGTLFSPKPVVIDDVFATLKEKITDGSFQHLAIRATHAILTGNVSVQSNHTPCDSVLGDDRFDGLRCPSMVAVTIHDPNSKMLRNIIIAIKEISLSSTAPACAAQSQI